MTVFIDPPMWPAHGRLFSHLISDTSVAELHALARRVGLPERAFDGDHYRYEYPAAPDLRRLQSWLADILRGSRPR